MPLYEYICRNCHQKFEALVRSWNEVVTCPAGCNSAVDKQVSTFAFASSDGGGANTGGGCGCGRGSCGCHQ